jgi:hypothetical protein
MCMATTRIPVESGLGGGRGGGVISFLYVHSLANLGPGKKNPKFSFSRKQAEELKSSGLPPDGNRKSFQNSFLSTRWQKAEFPMFFFCLLDGNRTNFQISVFPARWQFPKLFFVR